MRSFWLSLLSLIAFSAISEAQEQLVILHTNDTHSQIDPNYKDLGGVLRRKVLVDSVRSVEPNVMLVDAGDAVQGTLYYTLFGGEVERKMMNLLGYDIVVLGNHEFDSGMEALRREYSQLEATKLTTNYDLRATPLDTLFVPYVIREVGGRKIGFIGINLRPEGMISANNCPGVEWLDPYEAANSTAWHLRHNERVDLVIAITHVGYSGTVDVSDVELAERSRDIDIIIGGHTHTLINPADPSTPASRIANLEGRDVLLASTGSLGVNLGMVKIDLDNLTASSELIPVDSRLDKDIAEQDAAVLLPYRHSVDSILSVSVGETLIPLAKEDCSLLNAVADFIVWRGSQLAGRKADLGIGNKGGIRCNLPQGIITQGMVMQMQPFDNFVEALEVTGADLLEALQVMANRGDFCVSQEVEIDLTPETHEIIEVKISGEPLDLNRVYTLATIDYLAKGGDYLSSLKRTHSLGVSPRLLNQDFMDYLKLGPLNPPVGPRFKIAQ